MNSLFRSLFDKLRNSSGPYLGRHLEGKDSPFRTSETAGTLFLPKLAPTLILLRMSNIARTEGSFLKKEKKKKQQKKKENTYGWFSRQCSFKVVSLALTVCVWLVDSKTCFCRNLPTQLLLKRKRLYGPRQRNQAAIAELSSVCVCVCVCTCERVFPCANRLPSRARWLSCVSALRLCLRDTLVREKDFFVRVLSSSSSSSSSTLSTHHPWPSPSFNPPPTPPPPTHL